MHPLRIAVRLGWARPQAQELAVLPFLYPTGEPMLLLVGIEVTAGRHEGWLAFPDTVDMEYVFSRGQAFYR
jgi:hypothetical protein